MVEQNRKSSKTGKVKGVNEKLNQFNKRKTAFSYLKVVAKKIHF